MPALRRLVIATFTTLLLAAAKPAYCVDYTDIWWNPAESGWGVNLVQAEDVLFATFFVYGSERQPVWYVGLLTNSGAGVFSGDLYLTAGPWFAAPWDASQRHGDVVGTAIFSPTAADGATLTYSINGSAVSKNIVRQTLKTIAIGGNYFGGVVAEYVNCSAAIPSTYRSYATFALSQTTQGQLTLDFTPDGATAACRFAGTLIQAGQLYRISNATYSCGSGTSSADLSELKATAQGIEGRWIATVTGCSQRGYFSAVIR